MFRLAAALLALQPALTLGDLGPAPPGALRVFVVRHGQAHSNLTPTPDLPPEALDRLTSLGREQARLTGRALRDRDVALVVSSPKGRARETAEEVRAALGLAAEVRVDERLRPLGLGRAEGGRELGWDDRWPDWEAGRDPAPPGGESLEQVGERLLEAIRSLKKEHAGRAVVLVSHSEVISNLVGTLEGATLAGRFADRIQNGSITVAEARVAAQPRVLLANYVPPEPTPDVGSAHARAARPSAHRLAAP